MACGTQAQAIPAHRCVHFIEEALQARFLVGASLRIIRKIQAMEARHALPILVLELS